MEVLIEFGMAVALGLSGHLLVNWISRSVGLSSVSIIERAVARLPESDRERYREEWYAHRDECAGQASRLIHALGCLFCARSLARLCEESERHSVQDGPSSEAPEKATPLKEISETTLDVAAKMAHHLDTVTSTHHRRFPDQYGFYASPPGYITREE